MRRFAVDVDVEAFRGAEPPVFRVTNAGEIASSWRPGDRVLVLTPDEEERTWVGRLPGQGVQGVHWLRSQDVLSGDLVRLIRRTNGQASVEVLIRPGDLHHGLLLTNRCNSYCLMCSQPPTPQTDDWLMDEAMEVARLLPPEVRILGLSGGEPLLTGGRLRELLDLLTAVRPDLQVEVLTNGRLLSDASVRGSILDGLGTHVSWLVPLYGHADFLHDFVVQAPGAFDETIEGLLALQAHQQAIQLRVVLVKPVLEVLPELCRFIAANLPFVREVALMACEPIGFALANREIAQVDLKDWAGELSLGVRELLRARLRPVLMNAPLCALPTQLWPFAHRSISDWKNVYAEDCTSCAVKEQCCGLFAWHDTGWKPTTIKPFAQRITWIHQEQFVEERV